MIPDLKFYRHVSYEKNTFLPVKLTRYKFDKGFILSLRRRTQFKHEDGSTLYTGFAVRYRRKRRA